MTTGFRDTSGWRSSQSQVLASLLPLYIVIFIGFVGYSLMITVFTPMIIHNSNNMLSSDASSAFRAGTLGVLLALYPLGQFLGSPVMGALSDRFGRKPVLIWSLVVTTLCYGLIVASLVLQSLPLLLAASLLAGLAEANIVTAQGAIADLTTKEQRARFFGYIYMSVSLAYIVGPLLGGKLADPSVLPWFNDATPFSAVLLMMVGITVATLLWFRETRHPLSASGPIQVRHLFAGLIASLSNIRFRRFLIANFLIYLAIFGFFRAYPMYLVQGFKLDVTEVSDFIAWVGVPIVLVNLGLTGFLTARLPVRTVTIGSALLSGVFFALIVLPTSTGPLWPVLFFAGGAVALCLPACATMLSQAADDDEQGEIMGSNQALQVAAEALSGFGAGLLAAIALILPLSVLAATAILAAMVVAIAVPGVQRKGNGPLA